MARRSDDDETGPERTCVATRARRPPEEMIRFVLAPDGTVTPDVARKLPGRGVWTTAQAGAVREAIRRKAFGRSFKAEATVPATLAEDVDRLLERDALQALALANKAGAVVAGSAKVAAALAKGAVAALLQASDGGSDGARKIGQAARRARAPDGPETPVVDLFTSTQLDLALGRSNVIHAALVAGGAAQNVLAKSRRLGFYRAVEAPETARARTIGTDAGTDDGASGPIPGGMTDETGHGPGN